MQTDSNPEHNVITIKLEMTTRFDENKFTKPSRLDVASKHKVLREF